MASAPAPAPAPAPLDLTGATLAQLTNWANSQAGTATKAAEQPLVQQQHQTAAQYAAHGQAIQGFSTALGQLLANIAPRIQDDYTQAGNSQATFGKGFSDALQNQVGQSNDATNAFLSQMGAPAGALKPTPNVGDVAYGLGGYIPASTMNREGAAFGAAANLLSGNALAQGQQDFTANQYAASDANQKLIQQIAQIAATQPKTAQSALGQLEGLQVKQQTNQIAARKNAVDEIVKYGVDPSTGQLTAGAAKAMEQLTGAAPGTFTGMSAANAITLSDHAQTVAEQRAALSEKTAHDQAMTTIAQGRVNVASLTQQENVRYHNALIRIKTSTANGAAPKASDVRIAFTTAVKIGAKFLGQKKSISVGSVHTTTTGPQVPYKQALSSMESYWAGIMPAWTPKQVTAKAKQTLAAIPGYKAK